MLSRKVLPDSSPIFPPDVWQHHSKTYNKEIIAVIQTLIQNCINKIKDLNGKANDIVPCSVCSHRLTRPFKIIILS